MQKQTTATRAFLEELLEVCQRNEMMLSVSGGDDLQVRVMSDEEDDEGAKNLLAAQDCTDEEV